MNSKHRVTLDAVFTNPVSGTIAWAAIEALLRAARYQVRDARDYLTRLGLCP